jgi:VWFA-related protein
VVLVGVGVTAALAGLSRHGVGRVEAMDRTELSAWQQGAPSGSITTLQVYTRETVVDVTVTDKDGKPVYGLTQADFSVTEDDKPQSIRSFKEFSKDTPVTTSTPRKLPPNTYTNLVETGTGPLYVLLFDNVNGGGDTIQTRLAAAKFIKNMAPGTRVALLVLRGGSFTVLQGPTTDRALLLRMVRPGTHSEPIHVGESDCGPQVLIDWATLDGLKKVGTYLSGIQGKKNMIWIGHGNSDIIFERCQNWTRPLQDAYDLLEDAQVTVYPLDSHGLEAPPAPVLSGPASSWGEQAATQNADWLNILATYHLSMEAVAEATGGQAFYNTNDIAGAMANAADGGSSYYTLSYAPPSVEYDGRYHAISIKVDRPGIHVLYRKGYSAEDPVLLANPPETFLGHVTRDTRPTGPAVETLAAVLSPRGPPATQILFDVRVEPSSMAAKPDDPAVMGTLNASFKDKPLTRYGLQYDVLPSQIAFTDGPGGTHNGSLGLDVVVFDVAGKLVTGLSQTVKMSLNNKTVANNEPINFSQQIDLPPGRFFVRIGVFDGVSNKVGTLKIPLMVAKGSGVAAAGR